MNDFRADRLPNAGFMVEVDGQMKTWFDDKAAAHKAATELSTRFPMLQVKIYDAVEKTREMMSVPEKSEET